MTASAVVMTIEAGAARADEPAARPAFSMMDNTGDGAEVDVALPVAINTQGGAPDVTFRPRVLIQDFAADGFGGYGSLQLASQLGGVNDHETGLGNLEVGGLYHAAITPHLDVGLRLGVALDTATGGGAQIVNLITSSIVRPADVATSLPGNWLRVGVSPTYHAGLAFARLDAGVDVPVTSRDAVDGTTLAHVNVGAGAAFDKLTATAELSTLIQIDNRSGTEGALFNLNTLYAVGASVRYQSGAMSPYVAASVPLGNNLTAKLITATVGLTLAL